MDVRFWYALKGHRMTDLSALPAKGFRLRHRRQVFILTLVFSAIEIAEWAVKLLAWG